MHNLEKQTTKLQCGINAIKSLSFTALNRLRHGYVVAFTIANNIETFTADGKTRDTTKKAYARAIIDWVRLLLRMTLATNVCE
jgi:hypothetical protein